MKVTKDRIGILTNKTRGFTLIELLVVISIIGMLSSVVIASTGEVRDRGRIASGILFATHVYHGYGDQVLGKWPLDGSGIDVSGNGLTATLVGNPQYVSDHYSIDEQPSQIAGQIIGYPAIANAQGAGSKSLHVVNQSNSSSNTADQYAKMGGSTKFQIKNVTLTAWIKIENTDVAYQDYQTIVSYFPYYGMVLCQGKLSAYGGGVTTGSWSGYKWNPQPPNCPSIQGNQSLGDGKWHHVAMTTRIGQTDGTVLYVDGKIVSTGKLQDFNNYNYELGEISIGAKRWGTYPNVNHPFDGKIADVAIYPDALIASDIQKLYAQSIANYDLALR